MNPLFYGLSSKSFELNHLQLSEYDLDLDGHYQQHHQLSGLEFEFSSEFTSNEIIEYFQAVDPCLDVHLLSLSPILILVYPKVKVRGQDEFLLFLDDFESLSKFDSFSPVTEYEDNSPPSIIRIPESYISKGTMNNDKKVDEDEKPNIRASPILRPRAVLSSPENDEVIGNKNSLKANQPSALKRHNMIQNRHAHAQCKVIPSHIITESPTNTRRKSNEAADRKSDVKGNQGPGIAVPSQKVSLRTGRPSSLQSQVL